jgi:hypothetical protein
MKSEIIVILLFIQVFLFIATLSREQKLVTAHMFDDRWS